MDAVEETLLGGLIGRNGPLLASDPHDPIDGWGRAGNGDCLGLSGSGRREEAATLIARRVRVGLPALLVASALTAGTGETLSFEVVEEALSVAEREPVAVEYVLRSNTGEALQFQQRRPPKVLVRPAESGQPEPGASPSRSGLWASEAIVLEPGDEHRDVAVLSEWLPRLAEGRYVVTLILEGAVASGEGEPERISLEGSVALQVRAYDAGYLAALCERLFAKWKQGGQTDADALRLLTLVDDEVAVPYLAQLVGIAGPTRRHVVDGLSRIGSEPALERLVEVFPDLGPWEQMAARSALHRNRDAVTDPAVREAIARLLASYELRVKEPDGR